MNKVRVDLLNKNSVDDITSIYNTAFCSQNLDSLLESLTDDEKMLSFMYGLHEDDVICGVHAIVPSEVRIRKKSSKSLYLDYVAVSPQYRGRKHGRTLLIDAFERARKQNIPFVMMQPFRHSFYKSAGFASALDNYCVEINTELLKKSRNDGRIPVNSAIIQKDPQIVDKLFEIKKRLFDFNSANDLLMQKYWYNWIKYSDYELAYVDQEDSFGYLIYQNDTKNKSIAVQEFRWSDRDSFCALAKYLMNFKYYAKQISFESVPGDFLIDFFIDDYWNQNDSVAFTYYPIRMVRIVDVFKAIEDVVDYSNLDCPFSITIDDSLIDENNNTYQLSRNGCKVLEKVDTCDLRLGIEDFAYLLTGKYSIYDLEYLNNTYYQSREVLERINQCFPKTATWSSSIL